MLDTPYSLVSKYIYIYYIYIYIWYTSVCVYRLMLKHCRTTGRNWAHACVHRLLSLGNGGNRLRRCIKEMWDSRCKILIVASFWNRWWETCCAWQPLWLYPTVICGHLVFPMHTIHHRTFFSFANHCRFSKGANMCQSKVSYKWMTMPSKISLVSSHVHFTTPVTSCQL